MLYLVIAHLGDRQLVKTFYAANDAQSEGLARCFVPLGWSLTYVAKVVAN